MEHKTITKLLRDQVPKQYLPGFSVVIGWPFIVKRPAYHWYAVTRWPEGSAAYGGPWKYSDYLEETNRANHPPAGISNIECVDNERLLRVEYDPARISENAVDSWVFSILGA